MCRRAVGLGAFAAAVALAPSLIAGCGEQPKYTLGSPLPGLPEELLDRFQRGRLLFERPFSADEGLGPLFNQDRCSSCHDLPVAGGTGVETVLKATRWEAGKGCDLLETQGGPVLQDRATERMRAFGLERDVRPPGATAVVRLSPPPLFGLGLIETIDEKDILALEDPEDRNGDGISGRVALTPTGALARFGQKGTASTIEEFVVEALRSEIGLTSPALPSEEPIFGVEMPLTVDPANDPEISKETLGLLVDFVRLLAPSPPEEPVSRAVRDSIEAGRVLFHRIGCASCHVPRFRTGPSSIRAMDRKLVTVYSDFLLHDLGSEMADICGPSAEPSEWRTARLVGLRFRGAYMHHGGAASLPQAIEYHGGEASRSREAFRRLSPAGQAYLLRFLTSL